MSFSADKDFKRRVDERAASLGLSRTQYIRRVIEIDLEKGGGLTFHVQPGAASKPPRVKAE